MKSALGEDEGQPEGVVQVPMSQKNIAGAAQRWVTSPDIEQQTRRPNPEPGFLTGPRRSVDTKVAKPKAYCGHS